MWFAPLFFRLFFTSFSKIKQYLRDKKKPKCENVELENDIISFHVWDGARERGPPIIVCTLRNLV